jgi:DNA-binding transcriptional ArsR family regulator
MASEIDETLAALADPTRRAVVDLLRNEALRSGQIAAALSMSHPATSRHLRVLRRAGIVEEEALEEDARVRVYQLRRERFEQLRGWLDEVEAFWGDQLGAFKAHAERKAKKRRR